MSNKNVGFIGWRGMVGSVLMERMQANRDFAQINAHFFSTSQAGQVGPKIEGKTTRLFDANSDATLSEMDIVVSCQGGDYTKSIHPVLRARGWRGYWIDAASTLRMSDSSIIVLDPVNRKVIDQGLERGVLDFIGGNCTVSLMLMGLAGLFRRGWVEWISAMTYQSASGAGAKHMQELVAQMAAIGGTSVETKPSSGSILDLDRAVQSAIQSPDFPQAQFGTALAGSLIPWIDKVMENGQSREEWKGQCEANKILGLTPAIPIDGICVRVGAMRCHSQALTIKLVRDIPLPDIEASIQDAHEWVKLVKNDPIASREQLSPVKVSGTLDIPVGRVRKMNLGAEYLSAFTVGDQLLWGAAEPVRRALNIILDY